MAMMVILVILVMLVMMVMIHHFTSLAFQQIVPL